MSEEIKKLSAKQYLGQLEVIDIKIQQMLEELEALKLNTCIPSAIDYSKDKVQASVGDTLGNAVTRYMSLNDKIKAEINRFADIRHQVIKEIQSLNNANQIKVLYKVYVQYKSLKNTSDEMGVSYQHVRNVHQKALAAFENTYTHLHYLT